MASVTMACPRCGETSGLQTLERATIARPAAFRVQVEAPAGTASKYREPLARVRFVWGVDVVDHDADEDRAALVPDMGAAEWFGDVRCVECGWQDNAAELVPLRD